ncbi:MAG TPA: hypothetical protein VJ804_06900, partial [Acidimicrobiales bacterium]|nr:hypothetical protein [Acidimicrobiales bacterium]
MRRTVLALFSALLLLGPMGVASRTASADDLDSARNRANKAAADLARAESVLGRLEAEISDLEAEHAAAQGRLDTLRGAVREVAIQRFINADATQVAELDPDINHQARADALSRYATQGNQDAIDDYTAASEDLQVAADALSAKREAQQGAVAQLRERRQQLNAELKRLEALEAQRKAAQARRLASSGGARV